MSERKKSVSFDMAANTTVAPVAGASRDGIELTTTSAVPNGDTGTGQTNVLKVDDSPSGSQQDQPSPFEGDMLSGLTPKKIVLRESAEAEGPEGGAVLASLNEISSNIHEIRNMKYSHWECLCYFMFLIVFTTMAILQRGASDIGYVQTITVRNSLIELDEFVPWNDNGEKAFLDISTIEDFYRWMDYVALPFLLNEDDDFYVQSQLRLLGGIRLKQLRVLVEECSDTAFANDTCYDNFEMDTSLQTFYYSNGSMAAEFTYRSADNISDQSWRGKYGSYDGGGYVVDLPLNLSAAALMLNDLQDMDWIDGGTRFLTVDFNLYNPSTHLYTLARLVLEMPVGGVFPNDELKTWRFERYHGKMGDVLYVFHWLFAVSLVLLILMELHHGWQQGCCKCVCAKCPRCRLCRLDAMYWSSGWKYLDAVNFFFFFVFIYIYGTNEWYRLNSDVEWLSVDRYVSFRKLQYGWTMEGYCNAVNGLLLWLKLFKYMTVHRRLRFLFTMLSESSMDLIMFLIVLAVFIVAFGTSGFMTFTSDVDDFRSYPISLGNMVRFTISEMDYEKLTVSSRLWGSFFYFVWSLLMLLILANVFIAILSEAYSQVSADLAEHAKPVNLFGKLKKTLTSRIGVQMEDLNQEDIDEDGDGVISAEELADATGVSLDRAREVIAENDKDGDGTLDLAEFERLKSKLIEEQQEMQRTVSMREFVELKADLAKMTKLLGEVWRETPSGRRALRKKFGSSMASGARMKGKHERGASASETMGIDYLSIMDDIEELEDDSVVY